MGAGPIRYIIIAENVEVLFYSSREKAERYMEAVDVQDGLYKGYDAEGRPLKISPRGQASQIDLAEDEPHHAEDLARWLERFLARMGRIPAKRDLRFLLDICAEYTE